MPDADEEKWSVRGSELRHLDHTATIDYKHELVRKAIHLFSLSIPTIYFFISKQMALYLLVPITTVCIVIDVARHYIPSVARWFYKWFGWLLRRHETDVNKKRLSGASNVLISALLCVLLFPKVIALNAFTILIISDTTSALIGRRFGRHRFFAKSLEGSLAFFISALLVILIAPKIDQLPMEYFIGFIAAAIGTVVEALSVKIDDNISIPLSVGFSLWLLYAWLLPGINLLRLV
ncbi:MAG: SEC59/DGK1/VTE5 family protein [Ignavibacteriales bacterium]|nr:SEC59/DGK1/VTE5 family protein [Ignavibacteriales bacterium]